MYWFFILLYIVFFIVQLINLVKAVKNKDNKNWTSFFSIIISSIISCILIVLYVNYFTPNVNEDNVLTILISALAIILYCFILGLSFILKVVQVLRLKNKGVKRTKLEKNLKRKIMFVSIISIFFSSILLCSIDFVVYTYKGKIDNKNYDIVKKQKLDDMVNYINNKYGYNYDVKDNVFYREYEYSEVEKSEKKHDDFYVGIFDNGEKTVTVTVNENNFLSDNVQIEEIGYLISDYYRDILGINIEYVEIKNVNGFCKDDLINEVLQFKFNEIITKDNIETFIDELLKNEVEMIFYVKDNVDREVLLSNLINKLDYLEEESNIKELSIYLYDSNEDLIITKEDILTRGDYRYDEIHLSYYSSYMFGFVYVPNSIEFSNESGEFDKENTFVTIAYYNKKYSNDNKYKYDKVINDWNIYNLNK